jgi:hypothetical protein
MGDGKLLEEAIFRNCQFLQGLEKLAEAIKRLLSARRALKLAGWRGGKPLLSMWVHEIRQQLPLRVGGTDGPGLPQPFTRNTAHPARASRD